jgi:hypothetical protein
MGLPSLQHIQELRVHSLRPLPDRFVPPSGFDYPLDGLLPAIRAGFVSHQQRSWDSPFGAFSSGEGIHPFPDGRTHLPFPLSVYPHLRAGRLDRPRFLGFDPSRSPWRLSTLLTYPPLDAPLGLPLPGSQIECLGRAFTRSPLTRFSGRAVHPTRGAPESQWASAPLGPSLRPKPQDGVQATL